MVVYLSGPITGNAEFKKQFAEAEAKLQAQGFEVINPAEIGSRLPRYVQNNYEAILDFDLRLLDMAEIICLLPGWETSTGCNRERGFAEGRRIVIKTLQDLTPPPQEDRASRIWDGILGRT